MLNDPFECLPDFTLLKERLERTMFLAGTYPTQVFGSYEANRLLVEALNEARAQDSKSIAVLCLSKVRDNLLEWAHYADEHRGFVVGFDANHTFFQGSFSKGIDKLREIVYSKTRYLMPQYSSPPLSAEEFETARIGFLLTKSDDWAYEQELRVVAHPSAATRVAKDSTNKDMFLFQFPSECINEVVLGCRIAPEQKQRIKEILRVKFPSVALFQSHLHEREFALRLETECL